MTSISDSVTTTSGLTEKVAVITGGSRGIGFAAARELGALGATVILIGKSPENLRSAD